jgi:putrescine transport system substrate-binding protein
MKNPLEDTMKHLSLHHDNAIVSVIILFLAFVTGPAHAAGKVNVYNWAEYIGETTIQDFENEFAVKVTYDNYDSIETAEAKLLTGNSGYDVTNHTGFLVARLIKAGLLMELDKSKLPNFKHISPEIKAKLQKWDPDNKYIMPYMWGTHGVTYNEALIKSADSDAPIGSLDLIFKPEHMKKLAKCGVAFLDSPTDIIPMALSYLGFDPNSTNPDDYKQVEEMLLKIRPYIKTFDNFAYQRMPEKEFCLAVTWGPDGLFAMSAAEEAGTDLKLNFFLPPGKDAASIWIDGWIIPKDAANVEQAHQFINYMMRPQVAADASNFTWYATANKDAIPLIDEAVTSSNAAFPTPMQVEMMYPQMTLPKKLERIRTRTWTNFKAGG